MKTLNVGPQGSEQWHAARAWPRRCASEAAMAIGLDKRTSRTDGLRMKASGDSKEFSAWAQENLLNRGHEVEKYGIEHAQQIIGEELFPETATDDSGDYLASFDGINMASTKAAEVKLWNEVLVDYVRRGELPDTHWPQIAGQFIVGDELEEIVFVVTDGTPERTVSRILTRNNDMQKKIATVRAGWDQFTADVANYQHTEAAPAAVAAPTMALPALSIQVNGSITLIDNLALFGEKLTAFVAGVNKEPKDDQGFADLDAAVKTLQTAQDALEAAESNALAQTASIDEMRRTVAMYRDMARSNRLLFGKIVEEKKKSIRAEIIAEGTAALAAHIVALNNRLGQRFMPAIPHDFAGAAKGKRTIASLRDAVSTELARCKIAANEVADRIQRNLVVLDAFEPTTRALFADAATLVLKASDDFDAAVGVRLAAHKAAEAAKEEATRERIRGEEAAKLAKAQADKDAAERAALQAAQVAPPPTATPAIAQPAPIPAPPAWGIERTATVQSLPPRQRPSGAQLVEAVALHFRVSAATAADWLATTPADAYTGWPKSA